VRWGHRAVLGGVLAAACTDPLVPSRAAIYPFADAFGDVFHWPADRLPVHVYADPRGDLPTLVSRAVELWGRQLLYGEFTAVMVGDSNRADVIVRWADSVPPSATPDPGPPVKACGGVTQGTLDGTGQAFAGPFETEISILTGTVFTPEQVEACVRRTTVHELGHSLGLFQEASDTLSIMRSPPLVSEPAPVDRRTVQVLYHTLATLGPPPRRP
jgi:hypothetical protein